RAGPGPPPLPTRLVAGLFILKHMHNLSDEALCEQWVENPYFQYFCGEVVFRHELPFDRSSLTRWRQRLAGVHETGVAGLARITIQLDLGRHSLTVPPPSRPPCRSRWEARRFGAGA